MDENVKQRLDELRKKQQDIEASMNDLESQRVQYMVEQSQVNDEIARLEEQERKEAEELRAKVLEAEKFAAEKAEAERLEAERLNAVRIEYEKQQVERLAAERAAEAEKLATEKAEAERLEIEKQKAKKEKIENANRAEYYQMLIDYNKKLDAYNKKVPKLYTLQKQYENGKIQYEEYEKYATPLVEEYMSIKEIYEELVKLYDRLSKHPSLEYLTDEELNARLNNLEEESNARLNNLNDEYKQEWNKNSYNTNNMPMQGAGYSPNNLNNVDSVNITKLGKINGDISNIKNEQARKAAAIKNEQARRATARALSDEELDSNINMLKSALQSGDYDQDSEKIKEIKSVLLLLTNEKINRNKEYSSLTNEQLDVEIAKLDEEYMNEWNYSAHEANGMEADGFSDLDKLNMLNTIKANRLEMPKAPLTAMFILKKENQVQSGIPTVDPKPKTPPVVEPPAKDQAPEPVQRPEPDVNQTTEPTVDSSVNAVPESIPTVEPVYEPETTAGPSVEPNSNPAAQPDIDVSNNTDPYAGRPRISEEDVEKEMSEQYRIAQANSEQHYRKWYQRLGSSIKGWFTRTFSRNKNNSLSSGLTSAGSNNQKNSTNTFAENLQKYKSDPTTIKDNNGNILIDIYENSSKVPTGSKTPDEIDL